METPKTRKSRASKSVPTLEEIAQALENEGCDEILAMLKTYMKYQAKASKPKSTKPKACSAYNVFISKTMKDIGEKNPDLPAKERMREAVKIWATLSNEEKAAFAPVKEEETSV